MTAGGLVVTAPALAKDKKQEQQGPQLKLGDAVRKAAVAAQTALQAKDYATAQTNVDAVLAAATNDDERYIGQALKLSLIAGQSQVERSEERGEGKECVSTGRSRWSPYH